MDEVAEAEIFGPVSEFYFRTVSNVEPGHVARMRSINQAIGLRTGQR